MLTDKKVLAKLGEFGATVFFLSAFEQFENGLCFRKKESERIREKLV